MIALARRSILAVSAALCLGPAALAQQPDCKDPQTQTDMTLCAVADFEAADKALNAQWKITRKVVAEQDGDLDAALKGAEKALLKAQRAWIDYRDGECEVQGFSARGGTMEPMLVAACKADLTRARVQQLKSLAQQP